jgi:hypothetical protein
VTRAGAIGVALVASVGCGRTSLDWTDDSLAVDARPLPHADGSPPSDARFPEHPLVRFAVIGDYGADSDDEARVAQMVAGWNPDFVITTGDNNYPSGAAETIDANIGKHYARFIGNYHGRYGPGSALNRFWPSPGNHDWDAGSLAPYLAYFTLPGNGRYYDVAVGPVHLFAVDSDDREPDGNTEASAQGRWLEAALSASSACLDVVYFHHPGYSSGPHGSTLQMRWPFESWGADVVFAGHDHIYERVRLGGIRQFIVGVSGNETYTVGPPIPESEARVSRRHGALLVTVGADGTSFQFFADDRSEVDAFNSYKPCSQ